VVGAVQYDVLTVAGVDMAWAIPIGQASLVSGGEVSAFPVRIIVK
jgi:hypothetical protein